jgi:exosortase/archaeosortase family protein
MTIGGIFNVNARSWRSILRARMSQAHGFWSEATPRTRAMVQMAVLLGAVVIAYNYTLTTLIQNAGLETPLAYVSLVPAIALALAALRARPLKPEPAIHDRQVDYIVGVPLVAAALAANLLLPSALSAMFWVWRIDLLTLPVFVAGAVAIIFGVRVLWRQKLAVCYLFLGWPYPYSSVLLRVLNTFTTATLAAMEEILKVVHVAKVVPDPGNTLFEIVHNGRSFPLSVVSACSGVNSVVGFLLIASAFAAVVRGPFLRKVLWLAGGMLILWIINLGRITFIFWAGKTWGEHVAIDILHPFIGLVTFSLGVLLMIVTIRPLGMRIEVGGRTDTATPTAAPPTQDLKSKIALAVPRVYGAIVIVIVVAIILGVSNVGLSSYNLVADASGEPRLLSYQSAPAAPVGWTPYLIDQFDWAKPLFGDTSAWNRYSLDGSKVGDLQASVPVIADVIDSPDLESFSAYGVEACYQFHGYSLSDVAQVNLGGGITGQALSYTSQQYGSWSIVYWIVPVKSGTSTIYERVVLYVQNTGRGVRTSATATAADIKNLAGSLDSTTASGKELIENRAFLVAFAREMIVAQAQHGAKVVAKVSSSTSST